ncbi:MAG: serine/threonine-protein kinase [Cyanobacteriota bacterium]|nr:serine/threonine-protein kinase [Cyanobacteriota bacterium]
MLQPSAIAMSYCLNPHCSHPKNPPSSQFCQSCGTSLRLKDRYRPIKAIAQGGFGRTFLAIDEDKPSKPYCVIKQFFPQTEKIQALKKASQMFEREAVQLDILGQHPQIPALMAYFYQDNRPYLVQEFIEGNDLARELDLHGTLDETQIRALLNNILPVLQFVHQNQVIHRDIKPENLILRSRDKQLFLVDFGAAKAVEAATLGLAGTAIGSVGYIAPEQAVGRANYTSDLYSLGVTCIHLLTNVHPFYLYNAHEGTWIWRDRLPAPISLILCQILDKMLAPMPEQRHPSAEAILQALEEPYSQPAAPNNLDLEIERLRNQLAPQTPVAQPPQNPPPSSTTKPNPLDAELEEIRAELLGSTHRHQPPASS